jgi:hypothetical protein
MTGEPSDAAARWRMALGRHAGGHLPDGGLSAQEARMDRAMEALYGRGHAGRGFRPGQGGSLDPSQLIVPVWLDELKALFPKSVYETVQTHAVERLQMADLLANAQALQRLEPNLALMKVLMAFRGRADPKVAEPIRRIVRQVVEDLRKRLQTSVDRAFSGARNRFRRSRHKRMADFDVRATIRANLHRYQPDRRVLIAERLHFAGRQRRRLPWTVILCVDQSGSPPCWPPSWPPCPRWRSSWWPSTPPSSICRTAWTIPSIFSCRSSLAAAPISPRRWPIARASSPNRAARSWP